MATPADIRPKKEDPPKDANLPPWKAAWNALWNRDVEFYPRIGEGRDAKTLTSGECVDQALGVASNWNNLDTSDTAMDGAIKLARESLTEVTKQTEYQDQKATRLLTVTTFLTAFAGALFTRVLDSYPIPAPPWTFDFSLQRLAITATYLAFIAFIMSALFGALVIFHATRTRFKYPPHLRANETTKPTSLLFYAGIVAAKPSTWMQAWVTEAGGSEPAEKTVPNPNLKVQYFKNLVLETYLVAAKTADKLRYLQPAQSLLAFSMRVLFVWLVLMILLFALVPSTKSPPKPTKVEFAESIVLPAPSVVVKVPQPPLAASPQPARQTGQ